MSTKRVSTISFSDLYAKREYILLRSFEAQLMVNHVVTNGRPYFDASRKDTFIMMACKRVHTKWLSEDEGQSIELQVDEIGCPRKRSVEGIQCRTFRYSQEVYDMLLRAIDSRPLDLWSIFNHRQSSIEYQVLQPQQEPFEAPIPTTAVSTFMH